MPNDVAIKVNQVNKSFKLPHEKQGSVKNLFVNFFKARTGYEKQEVLKNISFEIKKGEFFGIVGRNGSGKSTLLKLMAGIYSADSGSVQVSGNLTPFIELGVGFSPELTGRENVFLNGALLGFDRKQMELMYEQIVEFAELEKFMDQKLKNYSSGMQVRLAFSIAIRANSDILILDEVLAVGDENFQRKCKDYFTNLKKSKKTVVLVTHDMESVRQYCDKAVLIKDGELSIMGSTEDVVNQYILENFETKNSRTNQEEFPPGLSEIVPSFKITTLSPQILKSKENFEFEIMYKITENVPVRIGLSLIDESSGGGLSVFDDQVKEKNGNLKIISTKKGVYRFRYKIPLARFNNRNFMVTAVLDRIINDKPQTIAYTSGERVARFAIRGEKKDGGLLKDKGVWVKC